MQPYSPYMPTPFAQPRRLSFVDGDAGMRAFQGGPGEVVALFDTGSSTMWLKAWNEAGMPSSVRYHLTEEAGDAPGSDVDARLAVIEESIRQLKEAVSANPVPDVRPAAAQHYTGDTAGA